MIQDSKRTNRNPRSENRKPQLIVALDVDSLKEATRLVDILYPTIEIFKVGSQLFTATGPDVVKMIRQKGARVFLDLKFHDIPNTVRAGTASAVMINSHTAEGVDKDVKDAIQLTVFMITVHITGGREMLEAAVRGATEKAKEINIKRPFIVGVTRLTSERNESGTEQNVLEAARRAKDAGLDGVVCSAYETPRIRQEFGKDFLIVNPGIRPKGYPSDDQARVVTAEEAVGAGADFIVVGRPIIKAKDPLGVAKGIVDEIVHARASSI